MYGRYIFTCIKFQYLHKMNLPLFISGKLSLSSDGRKSSPAVKVATVAVTLSVSVMIVAIAIVTGFKKEISSRVAGFNSDIVLTGMDYSSDDSQNHQLISLSPSLRRVIDSVPGVRDVALQAVVPAVFKTREDFKGIYLKSVEGKNTENFLTIAGIGNSQDLFVKHSDLSESVELPTLDDSSVIISQRMADKLDLNINDSIDTYFISDDLRSKRLKVARIYNSHFDDYDENYAFCNLSVIQDMAGLSRSEGTAINIAVDNFSDVSDIADNLNTVLFKAFQTGYIYRPYRVSSALQNGSRYFSWLSMLDVNVWVVLVLMTVVACVTLISGMLIIMVDKIRFISLMKAMGGSTELLSKIFLILAVRVAVVGMVIGDMIGIAIIILQRKYHCVPLDPGSYYMDFVPTEFSWLSVLAVNAGVIIIAWIMLIIPSKFVGRISPVKILMRE